MHILETTDLKKYYGTEPNLTRALEDLQVIRTVLDKASPSFQTLAASFRVLGILWLVPAGLLAFLQGESQISYLFALDHGIALYAGPNLLLLLQGAIVLLAAVWGGFLDGPLSVMNNVGWDLLDNGTQYIDTIAYSAYYASAGTVI